ncbi:hypothetical protein HYW43_04320 [Candidatus Daviesbacteria bacterium]|nr:hypothetical protein [Candidatus Daviesbacteria bacterium]
MSRETIYRLMHEDSDNAKMCLSPHARNHLVIYRGAISTEGVKILPLVREVRDAHGEEARKIIEQLRPSLIAEGKGRNVTLLAEGRPYMRRSQPGDWGVKYELHNHGHDSIS